MNLRMICMLMIATSVAVLSKEKTNRYVSERHGISLDVPVVDANDSAPHQIGNFLLPASDGFAPNVTVIKQTYPGTIAEYLTLSLRQFKTLEWKVNKQLTKKDSILFEYQGDLQGKTFHWYARAIKSGNSIFLVTGTCLESQWKTHKDKLIQSVDSFTLKK